MKLIHGRMPRLSAGIYVVLVLCFVDAQSRELLGDSWEIMEELQAAGAWINPRQWPVSANRTNSTSAMELPMLTALDAAVSYSDLSLGQELPIGSLVSASLKDNFFSPVSTDIINATMIAILTSSDLPPTPIVGATSGGSTAVGMVGLHPILRSLLAEGENLQAMWPFTESSPQLNYSGFGMRQSLSAHDMATGSPPSARATCSYGKAGDATRSVGTQPGMGWGLGSVLFEPRSAVEVLPVQSGQDGWVSALDDGRYDPSSPNAEMPYFQVEMWMLRLRNSLVSSTPYNMACGYLGMDDSEPETASNWEEAQITFWLPSCIRQVFQLNMSTTSRPIPPVSSTLAYDTLAREIATANPSAPAQYVWKQEQCEVQVCDSSLSALKWHHVLYWQDKRTTMPQILLDSFVGAGWNGSDCAHCRCPNYTALSNLGQCGECSHETRMVPNPLSQLHPRSGIIMGGMANEVAFGAFQFVSFLKKTSPRRLGPQFGPRLPPIDQGHWVIRNTSLEGYFEGRPTAYVRCDHSGLVAVGTPGGRTWLGSWSGPAWEGTPEMDGDRALVADSRRRAAVVGRGLPLRYRYLPTYLKDAKGDADPALRRRLAARSRASTEPGSVGTGLYGVAATSAEREYAWRAAESYGDSFKASDYAQSYELPWAAPRCVEPLGSDSPWQEEFRRHGLRSWGATHEEQAVVTLTLQVDPARYPPGSPQGDTLANKLRSEIVDLVAQIESSRIAVFLERSSKLASRSPPGMLAILYIFPSDELAPASGALGQDDDLPVSYDDDAGRITAEGGATAQNSPRMVAHQILDLFASPSDSILADTLSLAQRYPQDKPEPTLELLKKCSDGTFARICSATWLFSRGFIGLVIFFALSWGAVLAGRCCIDDSGIIADTRPMQKLHSVETSRSGNSGAARVTTTGSLKPPIGDSLATTSGQRLGRGSNGAGSIAPDQLELSTLRSNNHKNSLDRFPPDTAPRINYDDEDDDGVGDSMDGESWGAAQAAFAGGGHGSKSHVLAGYSLGMEEERERGVVAAPSGVSGSRHSATSGGIAAGHSADYNYGEINRGPGQGRRMAGSMREGSTARHELRSVMAGKPPGSWTYQGGPGPVTGSINGYSDGMELPSADSAINPAIVSGESQVAREGVLHGGSLSQSREGGLVSSLGSDVWRSAEGGSASTSSTNRMMMIRSRPLTRTSNIVVPAFGVVAMGCVYLQLITLALEQYQAAWVTILVAQCVFAVENAWYAAVRHFILVVDDSSRDAKLSFWYYESWHNRAVYWTVTVLSIFFGSTTCMLLQSYWRRWEVFSMPLAMSRNAPEAYPDVLRRHSSIPVITSIGPAFVVITLRVIGVFPPPPPGWPAMVTLAVLFLYFVFTIVSAYLARLDLRLDEQNDPDRQTMQAGLMAYVSEDSGGTRSKMSEQVLPGRRLPDLGPTLPAAQERPMGRGMSPPDPLGYGDSHPPVSESDGAIGETAAVGVRPVLGEASAPPPPASESEMATGRRPGTAYDVSTPGLSYTNQSENSNFYRSEGGYQASAGRGEELRDSPSTRAQGRVTDDGFMVQQVEYTEASEGGTGPDMVGVRGTAPAAVSPYGNAWRESEEKYYRNVLA